jgi:beta-N-acetylhexosaminidase
VTLLRLLLALVGMLAGGPAPGRPPTPKPASGARALVARLSTLQLLGQRIVYAYAGATPPPALLARVRAGEAAGVIFFGPNVADPAAFSASVRELAAANAQSPIHAPLLLMTDQEGGEVRRLPGPPIPSEKQIGESRDAPALASAAGAGAGKTLAAAGLNVNLAPVLDVFRSPGDFIDAAQRSYSSSPARVAQLAPRFILAQQHAGVAATAKHFPGLGAAAADQNTDAVPVTLAVPAAVLRAQDELPYRAAIAAGVKLVMSSWARYPALDPRRPAGLSSRIIEGELRGRLHFRGVVISDELAAGALSAFGTIGHRAVLAAGAGVDLLICSESSPDANTPHEGVLALDGLAAALGRGQLSRASALQAASRVIGLRSSLG